MTAVDIDIRGIEGFLFGGAEDSERATGCTVVVCPAGAVAGVDVRGGGPATRETDLLSPDRRIERIHAVVLSGGSAFGLEAASGVMEYLEGRGIGYDTSAARIPIVCGASLFDLIVGDARARPDRTMGRAACEQAFSGGHLREGNFGAGTGATVGKYLGPARMMKSGLGFAAVRVEDVKVGAVVAVNAVGDVHDPDTGEIIAGMLSNDGAVISGMADEIYAAVKSGRDALTGGKDDVVADGMDGISRNTTLVCVVTNVEMTKPQVCRMATVAHDGIARAVRPAHTSADGDAVFAMASGYVKADADAVSCIAADMAAAAIKRAALAAEPAYGLVSARSFR
ncbi:MAG: P1 family peptidase [Clostridiales Family XIII bacterium]|jgi:L-aminopeptidase/D-esterase-like protein|nr:P1 family peptidase [Clostridiales Family XIII bacterium]